MPRPYRSHSSRKDRFDQEVESSDSISCAGTPSGTRYSPTSIEYSLTTDPRELKITTQQDLLNQGQRQRQRQRQLQKIIKQEIIKPEIFPQEIQDQFERRKQQEREQQEQEQRLKDRFLYPEQREKYQANSGYSPQIQYAGFYSNPGYLPQIQYGGFYSNPGYLPQTQYSSVSTHYPQNNFSTPPCTCCRY